MLSSCLGWWSLVSVASARIFFYYIYNSVYLVVLLHALGLSSLCSLGLYIKMLGFPFCFFLISGWFCGLLFKVKLYSAQENESSITSISVAIFPLFHHILWVRSKLLAFLAPLLAPQPSRIRIWWVLLYWTLANLWLSKGQKPGMAWLGHVILALLDAAYNASLYSVQWTLSNYCKLYPWEG